MTKLILILASLLLAGCDRAIEDGPAPKPAQPSRFQIIEEDVLDRMGMNHFRDTKTGREYLSHRGGGIIELQQK